MTKPDLARAGRWLKDERERRGISVRAVASRFDVSTQAVYGWEAGKSEFVSDERAAELAELFALDIIEVRRNLGLWVPPEEEATPERPLRTSPTAELVRRLDADPELAPMILDLFQRFVRSGTSEEPGNEGRARSAS